MEHEEIEYKPFKRTSAMRRGPPLKEKSQTVQCLMIDDAKSCRSNSYCEWDDETKCKGKEDLYATVNRGNNDYGDEELGGGRTKRRRVKRGGRKTKTKRSGSKRRHTKRSGSNRGGRKTKRS